MANEVNAPKLIYTFTMYAGCRFPMAGPAGVTLQATRRGSRYWELRSQVQAAVAAAGKLADGLSDDDDDKSLSSTEAGSESHAFGVLEVRSVVLYVSILSILA